MNIVQQRTAVERIVVVAAAIAVIAFGMRWGADLILPIVIILYTTALVTPLCEQMVRKGWPKWLAILALILLLIGVFAGVFWLVIHSFRQMFAGLGETEAQMGDRLQALGGSIGNLVLSTGVEDTGARLSLKLWFVFLTMFAFGWLMGPAGVFLAGPLTILLVVFLSMFDSTHWLLDLVLADTPATTTGNGATAGESIA